MTSYLHSSNRDGDELALETLFAEVFQQHERRLYTLAQRLVKSEQHVKDIIQEVFLKLWEHRHQLQEIQNMEAWLYRVMENKIIDFLRKTAADSRLKDAIWNTISRARNDTDEWLEAKEYNRIIQQAIDRLPPQRRRIYCLHKKEGLDHAQIAEELSISRHTVKNQLSAAIRSIRSFVARNSGLFFL